MAKKSSAKKRTNGEKTTHQVAALPLRTVDGETEVCLITTRQTRRWSIPKGWPMKRRKPFEAAALEAEQEAGLYGRVSKKPVGSYHYWKRLTDHFQLVHADVYRLEVDGQHAEWPEKEQRLFHWFALSDAALLVDEPGLISLLLNLQEAEKSIDPVP